MNQPSKLGPEQKIRVADTSSFGIADDYIDLRKMLSAVLRYKWSILGLAFAMSLIAGFTVFSQQPVYSATASVTLETNRVNLVGVEDVYSQAGGSHYFFVYTQFEILRSREIVERAVRRLKLHEHQVFQPKDQNEGEKFSFSSLLPAGEKEPPVQLSPEELEEKRIQAVTSSVAAGLQVSQVGQYSLVSKVSYASTDPRLAARVANTVAEEFINSNLEHRLSGTVQATSWLNERLADLKLKLNQSEQALQDFREQQGLVDIKGETGLGGNELQSLSLRLQDARKSRIEAQNIMEDVRAMDDASTEDLMANPAILQHEVIRDIKREQSAAERKVSELEKRYGVLHPKMIAAESDLVVANNKLAAEVDKVVSGIEREYQIALRNEQQLEATWESRKTEIQNFNRVEFQLKELQREVEANRQLYDIFFARIKSVSETGGFEKPHARIVDRAIPPTRPFKPNKGLTVTVTFILGLILGCGVAIILDLMDNTLGSPEDVLSKLKVPLLSSVPEQKSAKDKTFTHIWQDPKSHYAEAIRSLRTSLILSNVDSPAQVILVTSTVPEEGKSTTAMNLAAAMGQMQKTLLIGADLRRPSLAEKCGLEPNHRGLSHFVTGAATLEDCIVYIEELRIHVMPAGVIPPNPLEMLGSNHFVDALRRLREQFDRIILDSAPVQAVSDALVLGSYSDSIVYVVRANSTITKQVERGLEAIVGSNEPLAGVVLNRFDPRKADQHYGANYYQYGDYY